MIKTLLLIISLSFFTVLSHGQVSDFEKFKQQREKEMNQFEQKVNREMDSLRTAHDKAFAKMLEGNWKREDVFPSKPASEKPKPTAPPVFKPDAEQDVIQDDKQDDKQDAEQDVIQDDKQDVIQDDKQDVIQDDKQDVIQDDKQDVTQDAAQEDKTKELAFNKAFQFQNETLFGNEWKMILIASKWPTLKGSPDPSTITAYWKSCSEKEYDLMLAYFNYQKSEFGLSDWGLYEMLQAVAKSNFTNKNDQNLFLWFTLVQMGYDARIMYGENQIVLTLPFNDMLFGKSYFEFNGHNYFILEAKSPSSLYTYTSQHESAKSLFTLANTPSAKFPEKWTDRGFDFKFNRNTEHVTLPYLTYRTTFDATIPQTELDYYFGQPLPASFKERLHKALDAKLQACGSEREQVRYLYALVCQSIPYKTDQDQFHYEKFCIPEEVLAYPFADCEDRTFLLNALVTELVGVETIGLNYPGHVAMAVRLKDQKNTDAIIQFNGNNYIYCDPTYIGADVGMMPESYRGVKPEVVK
jgi:hypothetical protein